MTSDAYQCLLFPRFEQRLLLLRTRVRFLKKHDPDYKQHKDTKLLVATWKVMKESLADPSHSRYQLGNTLGKANRHWRRCKKGLPPRYRLFFQFQSIKKSCIYVWLNDANTLRKAGDRNDVYETFKHFLSNGVIPQDFFDLLEVSRKAVDADWSED